MAVQDLLPKLEVFNFLEGDDYKIIEKYMFNHDYDEGSYVSKRVVTVATCSLSPRVKWKLSSSLMTRDTLSLR